MKNNFYRIIRILYPIVMGLIAITLLFDIFFADEFGLNKNKLFVAFEGILVVIFIIFQIFKGLLKRQK